VAWWDQGCQKHGGISNNWLCFCQIIVGVLKGQGYAVGGLLGKLNNGLGRLEKTCIVGHDRIMGAM
jgi:hypothetical protein